VAGLGMVELGVLLAGLEGGRGGGRRRMMMMTTTTAIILIVIMKMSIKG